ncbi:ATP-dependent RNA helicase DDX47/RRP3 [Paragonimus westermani]|uniref:RNA helicase n=1 Tax=Paragonimus westermani TaxID=34504 RepID=A0A5J4NYQ6_9TREM|nr:ATP-dependent RNA helicase DDX47/RRP3 [Paragonimus westermani]
MTAEKSFSDLGLRNEILKACDFLQWPKPTAIQSLAIPPALQGRNLVALAETGSGKTAAYALPIVHKLLDSPCPYFAMVLAPTRELAAQVHSQFNALGKAVGLSTILLVGGVPITQQADQMCMSPPHVIIATPGRLADHLRKTKGFDEFKLANLRFLVIDEADRMLGSDFDSVLEKILCLLPTTRQTFLFSATMTDKVGKLQRASIREPVFVSTRKSKFQSVANLRQSILATSVIVFTRTRIASTRLSLLLRQFLPQPVIALNGDMPQAQRLGALYKFKQTQGAVLVATDVASRGLDIPQVGLVVNYDVPLDAKTYMHRVGRTARAGRTGCALTLLTQYSVVFFLKEIESRLLSAIGNQQQSVPSLVQPNSEADRAIEVAIAELDVQVKEAGARSNQAVTAIRKRSHLSGNLRGSRTPIDIPTSAMSAVSTKLMGLKRTAWATEAPLAKRAEIMEVLQSMTVEEKRDSSADEQLNCSIPSARRQESGKRARRMRSKEKRSTRIDKSSGGKRKQKEHKRFSR